MEASTSSSRWRKGRFALLSVNDGKLTRSMKDVLPSPTCMKTSFPPSSSSSSSSASSKPISARLNGLIPRRRRLLFAIVTFALFLFTLHSAPPMFDASDVLSEESARAYYLARHGMVNGSAPVQHYVPTTDMEHLRRWIRFNAQHGLDSFDRLSFAQMGFQTSMYARVLRDEEVPMPLLREFEEKLWSFVPGLPQLRATHGHISDAVVQEEEEAELRQNTTEVKPKQASEESTRGLVIVTGDRHVQYVIQSISSIRQTHACDIPIEVYFCGTDDLSPHNRQYIERTFNNVRVIDLLDLDIFDESFVELQGSQWAMKPFALMASNFTQVILADADTVFLTDPHDFFTEQGYSETGTLFFHDRYVPKWQSKEIAEFLQEQLGHRGPSKQLAKSTFFQNQLSHLQESGLVVLNKGRTEVFAALLFTLWQNAAAARDEITYNVFYGEKETYWLAFELAGFAYNFSPFWAGAIGTSSSQSDLSSDAEICSDHRLHLINAETIAHKSDGKVVKHKRRSGKAAWLNGSMFKSKTRHQQRQEQEQKQFIHQHNEFLDTSSSVWAMDGNWNMKENHDGSSTLCLSRSVRRPIEHLVMRNSITDLVQVGKRATEAYLRRTMEHK